MATLAYTTPSHIHEVLAGRDAALRHAAILPWQIPRSFVRLGEYHVNRTFPEFVRLYAHCGLAEHKTYLEKGCPIHWTCSKMPLNSHTASAGATSTSLVQHL